MMRHGQLAPSDAVGASCATSPLAVTSIRHRDRGVLVACVPIYFFIH